MRANGEVLGRKRGEVELGGVEVAEEEREEENRSDLGC